MRLRPFIFIVPFLCWGFNARAQDQALEQMPIPEQWQMTLDEIKSKAQSLAIENDGLQGEYRQLIGQAQELQQSIADQQYKNEQAERFLQERHGRTDQQLHIDELTQSIKTKYQQSRIYDEQLGNLTRKQADLDRKIQMLRDMISSIELRQEGEKQKVVLPQNTAQQPPVGDQLAQWHKQLEDNTTQEVLLANELGDLKANDKTQNLSVATIEADDKKLEVRLDGLQLQKIQHEKVSSDIELSQATARMYDHLRKRKQELEADIYSYELRMDELRQASLMALSWSLKKKKMVHEMVQVDARNNRIREQIKVLREDIGVLKDQVAGLNRQVDSSQVKDNFVTFKTSE